MKRDVFLGSLLAVISGIIIVFTISFGKSLIQVFLGFILYILPFTFISSFKTTAMAFIFVFISLIIGYIILTYQWYDSLIGILLAAIIGGSVYFFRIRPYEPFSAEKYKQMAMSEGSDEDA